MNPTFTTLENSASTHGMSEPEITSNHHVMNVLLATDGSPAAESSLRQAINLVKNSGGRLILTFYAAPNDSTVFSGLSCQNSQEWQKYGQEILNKLAQEARNGGVKLVETVLEHYQEEERLAQLAQDVNANYIMLASHFL